MLNKVFRLHIRITTILIQKLTFGQQKYFLGTFLEPKASHELYKSFFEKLNRGWCQKELFFMKKVQTMSTSRIIYSLNTNGFYAKGWILAQG